MKNKSIIANTKVSNITNDPMEVLKSFENESMLSEEGKNTLVKAATLARSILPNEPGTSNKE